MRREIIYQRGEPWGRIVYDPEWDEFEAQIQAEFEAVSVDRPISAGCLVTRRCNLHCPFCYGDDESLPAEELSPETWTQIFAHLRSWGLLRVDISGGEPTVRHDLDRILTAATDSGLAVVLSTNGLLLADRGLSSVPAKTRLHVSVDSGFEEIHEASRVRRNLLPSAGSFQKVLGLVCQAVREGYPIRILTCVGPHNQHGLFELGELLAIHGVTEWNISRVLQAGRAQHGYAGKWIVDDHLVQDQIDDIRQAYPWMRIRYSNRTSQEGYFLLVLPNGCLATQYSDGRDKVLLGSVLRMTLEDLRNHPAFRLPLHARKWIAATTEYIEDAFAYAS